VDFGAKVFHYDDDGLSSFEGDPAMVISDQLSFFRLYFSENSWTFVSFRVWDVSPSPSTVREILNS